MTNQIQPVAADVTPTFTEFLASPEEKALEEKVYENLPTGELQQLIKSAQAGNQQALDKLCEQFRPLVEATARSYSAYSTLGEDALSIAWLIFIELVLKTDKNISVTFPGYIKTALVTRLINEINKTPNLNTFVSLDNEDNLNESSLISFENELVENYKLKQALNQLSKDRQHIIKAHYFQDKSLTKIACELNKDPIAVIMQHRRTIKNLRKIINKMSVKDE